MEYESFVYPPYDAPLIEAYGNRFESAFVILHPFVAVPEGLSWKTARKYPSDGQILSVGAKRTWASVAAETGIGTCAKMNQALLTSIRSINDELCDIAACDALKSFVTSETVWMPAEGSFQPLLQDDFVDAFESAGHETLIFVPEFPTIDPIKGIELAKLRTREAPFPDHGSLVSPDASFLFTVDWDSFFTLFYGPLDFVTDVVRRRGLEGFFATATTDHFWFNYSMGCCVVTLSPERWT